MDKCEEQTTRSNDLETSSKEDCEPTGNDSESAGENVHDEDCSKKHAFVAQTHIETQKKTASRQQSGSGTNRKEQSCLPI